jgi:flavin reductase (DIM6/NTAB) family NADH-FMN oxidoreductase RutF/rubredoxin
MDLKALHKLSYGIYVVASKKGNELNGQISNTVFQITSEPPTIAVSINKNNLTWNFIKNSGIFTVSALCEDTPLPFIGRFGFKTGRDTNKLEGVNYRIDQTGAPVVTDNAAAFLEARVTKDMDVGTHTIFVGEIVNAEVLNEKKCMTYEYYHREKKGVTPSTAPSYIKEEKETASGMEKYRCSICGWVYDPAGGDPDGGIKPGIPFGEVPDDWVCPVCGAAKRQFKKIE